MHTTRPKPRAPRRRPAPRTTSPAPQLSAARLAEALLEGDPDPERRHEVVGAARRVSEWLVEQGRPERWDTLDVPALVRWAAPNSEADREELLLNLTALLGFAGIHELIPAEKARADLRAIAALSCQPVIRALAEQGRAAMQHAVLN